MYKVVGAIRMHALEAEASSLDASKGYIFLGSVAEDFLRPRQSNTMEYSSCCPWGQNLFRVVAYLNWGQQIVVSGFQRLTPYCNPKSSQQIFQHVTA